MKKTLTNHQTAGNESTGVLKLIALVFMLCDHAGKMLFPHIPEMRVLGRIAFPLYAWCLVVGFCYTRSPIKYIGRLTLVGIISQLLYMPALNHTWNQPNIFFTLVLGIIGLWGMRSHIRPLQFFAPVLAMMMAVVLHADYGWKGVLLIFLLYACRTSRPALTAVMIAFCLYWGTNSTTIVQLFGYRIPTNPGGFGSLLSPWLRQQAFAVLSLPLILWHCPIRITLPHWVGYALYPAHLVLLLFLENMM